MSQATHHPRADALCADCGHELGADPVQVMDPAADPTAALGWLCIDCFDLTLLPRCPDDIAGFGW